MAVRTRRLLALCVVPIVVAALVGWWVYRVAHIPPQRSGDDWRVLSAQVPGTPFDEPARLTRDLTLLPKTVALAADEVVAMFSVSGGNCEWLRIGSIERVEGTLVVDVDRHTGWAWSGCDDIGTFRRYAVALSSELASGLEAVTVGPWRQEVVPLT